ncbi:hypothetical protein PBI_DEWDROP_63 [Microbacterium phage Dewdrop]|nr:hypothetical protein PBI_LEAF_63 [Microbacterium phage Leaf]QGZ17432.1 hypothetical protein PBI_DEWDROP_63 [Microbacterium phage Dewdrop]
MATHCFIPLLGKRLRATELDICGAPAPGGVYVVTDGFVNVSLTSEVEDGAEIIVKKANGQLCVNEKLSNSFKWFTVEIEFCGVNPSLLAIVSNATPYRDYAGDVAGFTVREGSIDKRFALELWAGLSGVACLPGQTDEASGYFLLPFVAAGVLGDITIDGENAVTFSLSGAYTKGGNQWGVGPYNVMRNTQTTNEVQTVAITGTPTGGTFTLSVRGEQTANIPYNASAAVVQGALEALNVILPGDVAVTGGPLPATVTVTFQGRFSGSNVPTMVATSALTGGTSPAVAIATTTQGLPGFPRQLSVALDPYDHLLLVDTALAPPPSSCEPWPITPQPNTAFPGAVFPSFPTITASDATNAARLAPLGFVATPTTAWTAGQKITVGTYAFMWNGTAWAPFV